MKMPAYQDSAYYWREIASRWNEKGFPETWQAHRDALHQAIMGRWGPQLKGEAALLTDLFDEAFGEGLHFFLDSSYRKVLGLDISYTTCQIAKTKHSGLQPVTAEIGCLPLGDGTLDAVISISTLDHLESRKKIADALEQIRRVLRKRGLLAMTLDNLANPLVALRNALPFGLLRGLGLIPYEMGATLGPAQLSNCLKKAGFEILSQTAVMHVPRFLAVSLFRLAGGRLTARARERILHCLMCFEVLERLPTRFISGHYLAVLARKA